MRNWVMAKITLWKKNKLWFDDDLEKNAREQAIKTLNRKRNYEREPF